MLLENTDLNEDEETIEDGSKNNVDEDTTDESNVEDTEGGDDEKDEDEEVLDPHEKKLNELTRENKQKGAAVSQKNKTIKKLKQQLETEGLDEESIKTIVDEALGDKMQSIDATQKKLDSALEVANDNNVDTLLSKLTSNNGEKKIFRHFLNTKVNKDLPLNERIAQAVILGKDAMSDDVFQADLQKAQEVSKRNSGKRGGAVGDIPDDVRVMGENLFTDAKSRKMFYDEYRKDHA